MSDSHDAQRQQECQGIKVKRCVLEALLSMMGKTEEMPAPAFAQKVVSLYMGSFYAPVETDKEVITKTLGGLRKNARASETNKDSVLPGSEAQPATIRADEGMEEAKPIVSS